MKDNTRSNAYLSRDVNEGCWAAWNSWAGVGDCVSSKIGLIRDEAGVEVRNGSQEFSEREVFPLKVGRFGDYFGGDDARQGQR